MIKTYFINSTQALYDDSEFAALQSAILEEGIIASAEGVLGMEVTENGSPDMNVVVSAGKALIEITKSARTFKVIVDNDADVTIPIASNSSGNDRVDAIVVRVDVDAEPNTLKTNVGTIERVAGDGVSPLSDGDITSALGSDGWYRLADVTVEDSETTILDADIADTRSKVITNFAIHIRDNYSSSVPVGMIAPYAGRTAPNDYLLCDGSAVSRSTYAALFEAICVPKVFTVTIASPAVFSCVGHGLVVGDKISLVTTGGLPSGLSSNVTYYVISAGLTADAFRVALSPTGAAVNTTGSQNGVHTFYLSSFGKGDGSTTFNVPDLRSRTIFGRGAAAPTITLDFETSAIGSNQITVPDNFFPHQGQKVRFTSTGTLPTGISAATDYYVIRVSSTLISLATSLANANAGTVMAISSGSGVHTLIYTQTAKTLVGQVIGEETHRLSLSETPAHTHIQRTGSTEGSPGLPRAGGGSQYDASTATGSAGGGIEHNIMPPGMVANYIIKT